MIWPNLLPFDDASGLMMKPTKHELMKELESTITADDYIAPTQWICQPDTLLMLRLTFES